MSRVSVALVAGGLLCCADAQPSLDAGVAECPQAVPGQCAPPAPTYSGSIQQLLQRECVGCHEEDSTSGFALTTYQEVDRVRAAILEQLTICEMPPADAGLLSLDDRELLLQWLVCQAPEQ